jgi:hypothetical protein
MHNSRIIRTVSLTFNVGVSTFGRDIPVSHSMLLRQLRFVWQDKLSPSIDLTGWVHFSKSSDDFLDENALYRVSQPTLLTRSRTFILLAFWLYEDYTANA